MSTMLEGTGTDEVGVGAPSLSVSCDVPDSYVQMARATSGLKYPIEVGAVANFDLPVTGSSGAPSTEWTAWPLVEAMPEDGIVFWLLRGDVAFDYKNIPQAGEWFDPSNYVFLAPQSSGVGARDASPGSATTRAAAFKPSDTMGSPWRNTMVWARMLPVTNADGTISNEPPYLVAYGFAGKGAPPVDDLSVMLESLAVSYQ
jgi:hypothetical protein